MQHVPQMNASGIVRARKSKTRNTEGDIRTDSLGEMTTIISARSTGARRKRDRRADGKKQKAKANKKDGFQKRNDEIDESQTVESLTRFDDASQGWSIDFPLRRCPGVFLLITNPSGQVEGKSAFDNGAKKSTCGSPHVLFLLQYDGRAGLGLACRSLSRSRHTYQRTTPTTTDDQTRTIDNMTPCLIHHTLLITSVCRAPIL
jgi:hypothetical protein